MKLTTIGRWGGYPYKDEGTTSYLLQADGFNLLIDAGSRAVTELEHELSPLDLDAVIISHYHPDHIADLGVLRQYRQLWPKDSWSNKMLKIYGHQEDLAEFTKLTLSGVSEGIAYDPTQTEHIGPFDITFIKTVHPVPCYAMKIVERATQESMVFTGDTGYFPELIPFVKGVDLFLADVYLFEGHENHPAHLTSKEAGQIAKEAGVKKLVLTHLPQFASDGITQDNHLEVLRKQAQAYAGEVPVDLSEMHKKWQLNEL